MGCLTWPPGEKREGCGPVPTGVSSPGMKHWEAKRVGVVLLEGPGLPSYSSAGQEERGSVSLLQAAAPSDS